MWRVRSEKDKPRKEEIDGDRKKERKKISKQKGWLVREIERERERENV